MEFINGNDANKGNKIDIVIGCSYGDEGKGKVVNYLVHEQEYDLCVRFNGSCNAGHTVYFNEQKFVLHQMPVGILREQTSILISSDCLIDIDKLKNNQYKLEDIVESKTASSKSIGKYKGEDVFIKSGKFGNYIT